jgi:hypothetical protein
MAARAPACTSRAAAIPLNPATVEMNQRLGPSQLCHLCRAPAALAANSLYAMGQCISGCRLWLPAFRLTVLCGKGVGRKHLGHLVPRWLRIVTSFSSCHTTIFANIVQVMKVVDFHEFREGVSQRELLVRISRYLKPALPSTSWTFGATSSGVTRAPMRLIATCAGVDPNRVRCSPSARHPLSGSVP